MSTDDPSSAPSRAALVDAEGCIDVPDCEPIMVEVELPTVGLGGAVPAPLCMGVYSVVSDGCEVAVW